MQVNTELEKLFFPVTTSDVFTYINGSQNPVLIPWKKVLINEKTNTPLSIVSNEYKIITNREAYNYGIDCLRTLFDLNDKDKIELINSINPYTLTFCHIDLTCPGKVFELRNDEYIPFVRITNSYNSMFRLRFRVGVCRSICENGMIFGEDSLRFRFVHLKSEKETMDFSLKKDEFKNILDKFKSDVEILAENNINKDYAFDIFCKGLGFKFKEGDKEEEKKNKINAEFNPVFDRYCKELGDNFYSLYNTITEIATRGLQTDKSYIGKVHGRQIRAGQWLQDITTHLRNKPFDYEKYLKDYFEKNKN